MVDFIQTTLDGLSIGSAYALIALGFTLVFGVMRRINLSYGPSIMLGAFAGTWIFVTLEAQPWQVAAVTIVGTILVGMYVERLCFWAIRKDAAVASMVSSFVIWMQLEEFATILLPGRTYPFPKLFSAGGFEVGPYFLRMEHVTTLAAAVIVLVLLRLLLFRTRFGLALRAVSENPEAAAYMGIRPGQVIFRAFMLVSLIGGVAGYLLLASDQQVTPYFGLWGDIQGIDRHDAGRNGVNPRRRGWRASSRRHRGPDPMVPWQCVQGFGFLPGPVPGSRCSPRRIARPGHCRARGPGLQKNLIRE